MYSDAHVEFIHHPSDLESGEEEILASQINAKLINEVKPELLFLAVFATTLEGLNFVITEYLKIIRSNSWILVLKKEDLLKPGTKIILHVEGLDAIKNDLDIIDQFYDFGVRSIGLTHNKKNQFAGGSLSEGRLTKLGEMAIKKILKLNMILDFAHLNELSFFQVLDKFQLRPFVSHTGLFTCVDNPRNISDKILRALKEKNGLVGIGVAGSFLSHDRSSIQDYLRQIKYAIKKVGLDKVCIGSDWGGISSSLPTGLESISNIKNVNKVSKDVLTNNLSEFVMKILK